MRKRKYRNSGYSEGGASLSKKTIKTYRPSHFSAKSDIDDNLEILRNRAHDLATNSAIGAAAISTSATNVVGVGLKLFPRINHRLLGISEEQGRDWSRRAKMEFELWSRDCDFLKRNTFYELQNIAYTSYLIDGDCFCLFKRRLPAFENPYSLRLQLIEAARVSNPMNNNTEMYAPDRKNRIINGIEVDANGTMVAVWISNKVHNEPNRLGQGVEWHRVKCYGQKGYKNLLHICHDTRPDQYRGVPYLAPVIEMIKQIARYSEAELTSAIIKSFFSIFFTQPASNFEINQVIGEGERGAVVDVNEYKLGPATMAALPRGVDVKAIDSANSQSSFEVFLQSFLKQTGAALNIPYEVLFKTFQSSYSASRAALLQASDEFKQRKSWFINDFCRPIYEQFLMEAVAIGRLKAPGFFEDITRKYLWSAAEWYTDTSRILDPIKEVKGAAEKISLGLSTYEKEAAELAGTDFEENLEILKTEQKMLNLKGGQE